jgi:hypothetical protein
VSGDSYQGTASAVPQASKERLGFSRGGASSLQRHKQGATLELACAQKTDDVLTRRATAFDFIRHVFLGAARMTFRHDGRKMTYERKVRKNMRMSSTKSAGPRSRS